MVILLTTCLILGAGGAAAVGRFGPQMGFLDTPNYRSSHSKPTPKGGGIGILASFLAASLVSGLSVFIWLPTCILSVVSMYSDRVEISPGQRLFCQLVAAATILGYSTYTHPATNLGYLLLPLWVVFIVGTANFYNFMDGINGIAGLTGCLGFAMMAFFLHQNLADPGYILLSLCLSSACAGFLPFNMPKARVFMGDLGSILLGFIFAVLVYLNSGSILDFLCYASLLFPYYIDELSTMAVRIRNGEKLSQAHRKHLYQIFANEREVAHWKISCCYALLQLSVGTGVFLLRPLGEIAILLFLFAASLCFVIFSHKVRLNG